jgi:hypothetical protein
MTNDLLGRRVKFCPASFCVHNYVEESAPLAVGEVVTVNEAHHTFTVKYSLFGNDYLETFNVSQFGNEVVPCGK